MIILKRSLILTIPILVYIIVLLKNAWLCDDAYISLRVVDNFVNGYGLTWNVAERVQAFTHPLWVLILIPLYALTHEVYFTVLSLSLIFSLGAVAWFAFGISRSIWQTIIGLLAIAGSAAMVDFSTSGLENPLTFFILAAFLYVYFRRDHDIRTLILLSLIAALGAVNRMDTILLFLPAVFYLFWKNRSLKSFTAVIIGFIPFIAWEIFSLVYYGFPFPNTAYAKLNTGLPASDIWTQGLHYIQYSLTTDPVTIIVIFCGILIPLISRQSRLTWPAIGIILYLIYIINIGGCFMAGRYLAAPFFMAVITLSQFRKVPTTLAVLWTIMVISLVLSAPDSPHYSKKSDEGDPSKTRNGIVAERDWYNPTHGLFNVIGFGGRPVHNWIEEGLSARRDSLTFIPHVVVGMVGFYSGPQAYILDAYAITDPLLARLPVDPHRQHRIGHFGRSVPVGYEKTVRTGQNHIRDDYLAQYYDKLALLTRGDLLADNRLIEIVKFNLGYYDYLIEEYLSPHKIEIKLSDISPDPPGGLIASYINNIRFYRPGLEIDLEKIYHSSRLQISHGDKVKYRIEFYRDTQMIVTTTFPAMPDRPGRLPVSTVSVPESDVKQGYDRLLILPEQDGDYFNILSLRFLD